VIALRHGAKQEGRKRECKQEFHGARNRALTRKPLSMSMSCPFHGTFTDGPCPMQMKPPQPHVSGN